jgi:hypothetical protein
MTFNRKADPVRKGILTFTAAACGAMAATASAADFTVFATFVPVGNGLVENASIRASAILTTDDTTGATNCLLSARGLLPNTLYGVRIGTFDLGASNAQAFTTNSFGRGTFQTDIPGFITPGMNPEYLIYRWDGAFDDPNTPEPDFDLIWDVTADEIRAAGVMMTF